MRQAKRRNDAQIPVDQLVSPKCLKLHTQNDKLVRNVSYVPDESDLATLDALHGTSIDVISRAEGGAAKMAGLIASSRTGQASALSPDGLARPTPAMACTSRCRSTPDNPLRNRAFPFRQTKRRKPIRKYLGKCPANCRAPFQMYLQDCVKIRLLFADLARPHTVKFKWLRFRVHGYDSGSIAVVATKIGEAARARL
ncbi:hypothetical protein GGD62_007662 [Bradyrhizobium sp. ERR14]|nr:hypothetical protein [Bradyrhizobium sp. ERR14]